MSNLSNLSRHSKLGQFLISVLWKYSAVQCSQTSPPPNAEAIRECQENWNGYELNIQPTNKEWVEEEIDFNATHSFNVTDQEMVILTKLKSFGQYPAYVMWGSIFGLLIPSYMVLKYIGII